MSAMQAGRASRSFECDVNWKGSTVTLSLSGFLDEDSQLPKLDLEPDDEIVIDFSHFMGMDAAGVTIWESFCFRYASHRFTLRNCPEAFVKNANFFPGFMPSKCTVESFQVKFRCDDCANSTMVDFVRDRDFAVWVGGYGRLHAPEQIEPCSCGSKHRPKMVEAEAKYLAFLKRSSA